MTIIDLRLLLKSLLNKRIQMMKKMTIVDLGLLPKKELSKSTTMSILDLRTLPKNVLSKITIKSSQNMMKSLLRKETTTILPEMMRISLLEMMMRKVMILVLPRNSCEILDKRFDHL